MQKSPEAVEDRPGILRSTVVTGGRRQGEPPEGSSGSGNPDTRILALGAVEVKSIDCALSPWDTEIMARGNAGPCGMGYRRFRNRKVFSMVHDTPDIVDANEVRDARRHNFFMVDNVVVDAYLPVIGPTGFAIYSALVRIAGSKGSAFPSVKHLAKMAGTGESTARRHLAVLASSPLKSGEPTLLENAKLPPLIRIDHRYRDDGGGQTSSVYVILPTVSPDTLSHKRDSPLLANEKPPFSPARDHEEDTVKKTSVSKDTGASARKSPSGTERQSHNEGQVSSTGATLPGMPEPVETGTAKKRGTAKREGEAEKVSPVTAILEAYCAAVGVERLTNYGKAGAQAKKLVEAGFTPEDIPSMVAWIRGQSWLKGGFDLGTLLNQADKWRATQTKPKGPKRFVV